MVIISKNNYYAYGVSLILNTLYDELEQPPSTMEQKIYITAGSDSRTVLNLIRDYPPSGHSFFICCEKVKTLMNHQGYSGEIYFIDENSSVNHIRNALKIIMQNHSTLVWKSCSKLKMALTEREQEVFTLLIQGCCVNNIAKLYGISPKTVYSYKYNIMAKKGVSRFNDFFVL